MPTTSISLIRENTVLIRPPRALWVPFPLGRPFGAPHAPDFQHRVLRRARTLLARISHTKRCIGLVNPVIPNSLQNPKVLMGYDPEIVGDGISPFCPLLWQSSAEEIEDSVDEVPEVGMEPVVGHFAVHYSP